MPKLDPQLIMKDVSEGVINGVKHTLCPENSVDTMINMVADDYIGEAVVRKGSLIVGAQINGSNPVLGHYQFVYGSTPTRVLLAAVGGNLYYLSGSTWQQSKSGDNASASVEFETFLDQVCRVNGVDSPLCSTNGTSWGSSSAWDTAHMPTGKFVKVYKDQVVVAGASDPDTLYISSVPTSNTISWVTNDRTIMVNPEDGQNITALGEVGGLLIVFKDRAMYRWNNRSLEPDTIVEIGCNSQKSVVNCGSALAFFNDKGFWLTSGEQPVKISRKIQKWIDGRTSTFLVPCYGDEEYLFGSLGSCTVDGASYTGVVVRYSMLTKEWVVYKYPWEVRSFARYYDSEDKITAGTSLSKVEWIEDGNVYTDDGTDIAFEVQTHDMDFGSRGILKQITERAFAYCKNPDNTIIQVQINGGQWMTLGVLNREIEQFLINQRISGHYFRFRAVGISGNRTRFQGIELPSISLIGYDE